MRHILLPLDGSATSKHSIEQAISFARAFKETKFTLLYVLSHPEGEMMTNGSIMMQNAIEAEKEKSERMLEAYREEFGEDKDRVSVQVAIGPISSVIIDMVETSDIDYIIMGSQGLGSAMRRLLVGSVAKKVLTSVDVPVLVVR